MGIDRLEIEVKEKTGTEIEKEQARTIRPMLAKHHILLSTLLLGNALCFEALPIFIDALIPSWLAVLLSITVILIFGEVLPQAYCVGKDQIKIAAGLTPVVKFFIYLFMPVTWLLAAALDRYLGLRGQLRYKRKMLIDILDLHQGGRPRLLRSGSRPWPRPRKSR